MIQKIKKFQQEHGHVAEGSSSTGIMLLFSAGTFLYVATVHVLPELAESARKSRDHILLPTTPNGNSPSHSHGGADFSALELCVLIVGSIMPAILTAGHHH